MSDLRQVFTDLNQKRSNKTQRDIDDVQVKNILTVRKRIQDTELYTLSEYIDSSIYKYDYFEFDIDGLDFNIGLCHKA